MSHLLPLTGFRILLAAATLTGALALTGCAVPPGGTPEPSAAIPTEPVRVEEDATRRERVAALEKQFRSAGIRLRAICVSPENRAYFRKTSCLASAITEEMKADTSKPTDAQKKAARNVFRLTHELNEETRTMMVKSGLPEYVEKAFESRTYADPKIQALQRDFLEGELTWGEYNQARAALVDRDEERGAGTDEGAPAPATGGAAGAPAASAK